MPHRLTRIAALALLLAEPVLAAPPPAGPPPLPGRAVWLGLHFIDTSTEGAVNRVRADETARIRMAETLIAGGLKTRGFTLIDPPADRIAGIADPLESNGAGPALARDPGADDVIEGRVQKVSNLTVSLNLHIRDAQTGRAIRTRAVDICGEADESLRRATAICCATPSFGRTDA